MRRIFLALPLLAATMTVAQAPVQPPAFKLKHVYPLDQPHVDRMIFGTVRLG